MSVARACGFSLGHACTVPEWNARKTEPKNAGVRRKEYSPSRAQEKLTPPGRGRAAVEDVHHETCTACEWFGLFSSQALFFRSSGLLLSRVRFFVLRLWCRQMGEGAGYRNVCVFCLRTGSMPVSWRQELSKIRSPRVQAASAATVCLSCPGAVPESKRG